jgi:hypothetical protein
MRFHPLAFALLLMTACANDSEQASGKSGDDDGGSGRGTVADGSSSGGGSGESDGGDPTLDGGTPLPPGSLGASCDRSRPDCNAGLECLYGLSTRYTCQPETNTCDQPAEPTGLPVGFIYGNWSLPAGAGYSDVSLDMHPIFTGPDDGSLQYFAFAGQFPGGPPGSGIYSGLQTKISNKTAASGKRGVIFTGFSVTQAVVAAGAYADINLVDCDGGIGAVCAQLSLPYAWKDGGTYRFRFHFAGDAPNHPGNRLLRTSVTDVGSGVESTLGDLIVPKTWGSMPAKFGTFDETFPPSGAPETCQNYNPSDIEFLRLRGDGATGTVVHADGTYQGPCVNNFHYRPVQGGYRMLLGLCLP